MSTTTHRGACQPVTAVSAAAYTVPTDAPESDGTFEWDSTTIVIAEVRAGGLAGIGYTYTAAAAVSVIREQLAPVVIGSDAMSVPLVWHRMVRAARNLGRSGIASCAIAAVDTALWDLKAKLLGLPLVTLLGAARDQPQGGREAGMQNEDGEGVLAYASGGFTSYSVPELQAQLAEWVAQGIPRVKMKVGRDPRADLQRVRAARLAIGEASELFVDANGAYTVPLALAQAQVFAESGVTWFEEPVPSDDLQGLYRVRSRGAAGMDVSAGEYGYDIRYFARMLRAGAVDVLQADATRCAGITEFLRIGALCTAYGIPLSAHTAPSLHLHPACALSNVRHIEYFHDHVQIEREFFDGARAPVAGMLTPDLTRHGLGLELRRVDVERFRRE